VQTGRTEWFAPTSRRHSNMDKTEIASEIRRFVVRESNLADDSLLGDDVDLFSDGILDSLMVVSLVSFCEERFGCELSGQEFSEEDLRTIAALATLVAGRKPEQH
jgi:acyl carrier protein